MKKLLNKFSIGTVGFLTPALAFAAANDGVNVGGLIGLLGQIHQLISAAIPVLIALAVLAFMWGIVMYLFTGDKEKGKDMMLWGVIALFVMTSVWGLVGILRGSIFNTNDSVQNVPLPSRYK
ncbi:MAG: hypothetical protein RLZZ517_234 [Candidatus Parcubacteria bacterium]|jgi:uncharacterized protein with PQ loop repeat